MRTTAIIFALLLLWLVCDAQAGTVETQAAGKWSDSGIWLGGTLPGRDDDATIKHAVKIDEGTAKTLTVAAGATTILEGKLDVYGSIMVSGVLEGARGTLAFHVGDDRLFVGNTAPGPDPSMPDFHPADIGLWVMPGGRVTLTGPEVTSWLDVSARGPATRLRNGIDTAPGIVAGAATLMSAPTGWQPGDTLLLCNPRGQSTTATLATVAGDQITFTGADTFVGNVLIAGDGREVPSKVANLSRRIQIIGADVVAADSNHRAHVAAMPGSTLQLSAVELRNLGPRAKLGRYPCHFHKLGAGGVGSYVRSSSVWQDVPDLGNRGIAPHAVAGVEVTDNVVYRVRGHAIFMEDGTERDNTVNENLVIDCFGPEELANNLSSVETNTYSFWLRPGNEYSGNVAVGGDNGFILLVNDRKVGSEQDPRRLLTDCVAMGVSKFGIQAAIQSTRMERPVSVYAGEAGIGKLAQYSVNNNDLIVNEPLLLNNGARYPGGEDVHGAFSNRMVINGGFCAGMRAAIKVPQPGQIMWNNPTIRNAVLFHPIFLRSDITLVGGDVEVDAVIQKTFLWGWKNAIPGDNVPHFMRLNNVAFKVGATEFPNFSGAWTHPHWASTFPGGRLEYFLWRLP